MQYFILAFMFGICVYMIFFSQKENDKWRNMAFGTH
jgi:hypothetical protein